MSQITREHPRKKLSPIQAQLVRALKDMDWTLPVTALADHTKVSITIPLLWGEETTVVLAFWKEMNLWVAYHEEDSPFLMLEATCSVFVEATAERVAGMLYSYFDIVSKQMGVYPANIGIFRKLST